MTKPNGWTGVKWEIEGVHVFVDDRIQVCCGRGHHECCGSPDIEGDRHLVATAESENYARLIAAAPSLYEALAELRRAYVNLIEHGRDQTVCRGGQCDPVDVMEARDPYLAKARAALSAAEGG